MTLADDLYPAPPAELVLPSPEWLGTCGSPLQRLRVRGNQRVNDPRVKLYRQRIDSGDCDDRERIV